MPHGADRDDQLTWLYDWWERIDGWITEQNQADPAPGTIAEGSALS